MNEHGAQGSQRTPPKVPPDSTYGYSILFHRSDSSLLFAGSTTGQKRRKKLRGMKSPRTSIDRQTTADSGRLNVLNVRLHNTHHFQPGRPPASPVAGETDTRHRQQPTASSSHNTQLPAPSSSSQASACSAPAQRPLHSQPLSKIHFDQVSSQ